MMKPTLERIPPLLSTAADLDKLSCKQDVFFNLPETDREEHLSDEELSDEELSLAAGDQSPVPAKCADLLPPIRSGGMR